MVGGMTVIADIARFGITTTSIENGRGHFDLRVASDHCSPFGTLYGGVGIAASVACAEAVAGRPLMWVTTHFVTNATAGEHIAISVDTVMDGRATSQIHVHGRAGDRLVFSSFASLTERPDEVTASWATMPAVDPPEQCAEFIFPFESKLGDSFMRRIQRRTAFGRDESLFADGGEPVADGRIGIWYRLNDGLIDSAATLAYVADVVPAAVNAGLGRPAGGTSLDNTLRVIRPIPSEWVLLDVQADGFGRSIGQGTVHVWSPDGELLGVASQSCIIRTSHHQLTPQAPV
jgi:acyl-CoA thioesterase II